MEGYVYQLVSRNADGEIVQTFTEPSYSSCFAKEKKASMGDCDEKGNQLEVALLYMTPYGILETMTKKQLIELSRKLIDKVESLEDTLDEYADRASW